MYNLSPLQQGMLFHALSTSHGGVDIEQIEISMRHPLSLAEFRWAWQAILDRHSILRTAFAWEGVDQPQQIIYPTVAMSLDSADLRSHSHSEQLTHLQHFREQDRLRGFDLTRSPLMRVTIFRLGTNEFYLFWTFHHIILDGRSFHLLLREFFELYEAKLQGKELELPLPRPFSDYLEWRKRQNFELQKGFWQTQLAGATLPTPLDLGTHSRTNAKRWGNLETTISAEQTAKLQQFADQHNLTMHTLLQGAWGLILHHYSRETSVVFGSTRACRYWAEDAAERVGLFINTVPMRLDIRSQQSLIDYLHTIRDQQVMLRRYEHTPLSDIQRWSGVAGDQSLFTTLLVYDEATLGRRMKRLGGNWEKREVVYHGQTNFPLTMIGYGGERLTLRCEYDPTLFSADSAGQLFQHWQRLLGNFIKHGDTVAFRVPYLSSAEQARLTLSQSQPRPLPPVIKTIHELFQYQVSMNPHAIALTYEGLSLTYSQLNTRANQLAHHLQKVGVLPETVVGLAVDRSFDTVIGILGILKARAAYLPLDPASPTQRLKDIAQDAALTIIVTQRTLELDQIGSAELFYIEDIDPTLPTTDPICTINPDHLAYIIYTSGSTGKAKGVQVTHRNVMRLFTATEHWFQFNSDDVWTLFHSYAFDFSVWELWGAFFYGGRVVIVPQSISHSAEQFHQLLIDEGVTVLNQTPSAFRHLIDADQRATANLTQLRYVIFGGEALALASLQSWVDKYGDKHPQLINMYGITETTVHVTYRPITRADIEAQIGSVIGVPIPDLQLYLFDEALQPTPYYAVGELYVGGLGVSNGYLNRPELMQERFLPHPFNEHQRLYKTGDLARRYPNGEIEYIGRTDHQVKIRGFRIELGEIEAVINQHAAIQSNVVIAHTTPNGDRRLVAYLIPRVHRFSTTDLRDHLKKQLPDYMIPAAFMTLEKLPLTTNGKLDYRSLPQPTFSENGQRECVPPANETEKGLVEIWQTVLQHTPISVEDSFFEIGGDSLLAMRVVAQMREKFGRNLAIHHLYEYRTIRAIAQWLTNQQETTGMNGHHIDERVQKRQEALRKRRVQKELF